jgi:F-type H+-transporting ATPase subunit gamma
MATLRQIRRRIKSVKNTQQITRVMRMVAAAKLAKAQVQAVQGRAYAEALGRILARVSRGRDLAHPLLATREVERRALLIVTSDRGLCGGYNHNLLRLAERTMAASPKSSWRLYCVGKKGREYFRKRSWNIAYSKVDTHGNMSPALAAEIAAELTGAFERGEVDEVQLAYTQFKSVARTMPVVRPFVPIRAEGEDLDAAPVDYILEPDLETVMDRLLPDYIQTVAFTSLLEAVASEHASRMLAMQAATENAKEVIEQLTLEMNKARQGAITKELADIVGAKVAAEG